MTPAPCVFRYWLLALALLLINVASAHANVYATNIKVNGSLVSTSVPSGTGVQISYILNEPASGGVKINILAGNSIVRTLSISAGSAGTLRGTNSVVWDGLNDSSTPVSTGNYSVAITASTPGYNVWTQISDDMSNGNAVWEGRGIGVNQNTNSPYYGRVYVANAQANDPGANDWLGYQVGILKCNADASYADEGGLSTGGYPWAGDSYSPWHLAVSPSDRVYVDDFTTNGQVIAWDPMIADASELPVLHPDNWANENVSLSGPALSGSGTNAALWMADVTMTPGFSTGLGILRFSLLANGTCATGDTGTIAVAVGGSLTGNPVDVALDALGNIYTIQANADPGDPNNRVFRFPPFDPATNSAPLSTAEWAIGAGDDTMAGAQGLAVDPSGTYLAVAFTGLSTGSNGCTQIFYATNGALVTNLDLGINLSGFVQHEDEACAWDAVGNVYYIDNVFGVWRTVSPPGSNSSTTMAPAIIQVGGSTSPGVQPVITRVTQNGGVVLIDFTAGTNDTASLFKVGASATVTGQYLILSTATVTAVGPGQFQASLPSDGSLQFYRIVRQGGSVPPPTLPTFTNTTLSGNNLVLSFSGNASDVPANFTLLSSATANGTYTLAANASITQTGSGTFQAVVPVTGPVQFYRIKR